MERRKSLPPKQLRKYTRNRNTNAGWHYYEY